LEVGAYGDAEDGVVVLGLDSVGVDGVPRTETEPDVHSARTRGRRDEGAALGKNLGGES